YRDVYGTPFAFFATLNIPNQYNAYYSVTDPYNPTGTLGSDCRSIGAMPYRKPDAPGGVVQYQNADTYQIVSAGPDKTFGSTVYPGVIWNPTKDSVTFVPASALSALDDRTNFCPNNLGAGNN